MEYDKVIIITLSIVGATLTWLLSFVLFVLRSDNKKQDMKMDEMLKTLVLHSISLENHNEKILQNKVGVSDFLCKRRKREQIQPSCSKVKAGGAG